MAQLSPTPLNPHRMAVCPFVASFRHRGWGLYVWVLGCPSMGSHGQTVYEESACLAPSPRFRSIFNLRNAYCPFPAGKPSRPDSLAESYLYLCVRGALFLSVALTLSFFLLSSTILNQVKSFRSLFMAS